MANYIIEFRFQSKRIRSYLKEMIYEINKRFGVGKKKHVPHITLVGPITTNQEQRLISDFARICSETALMKFKGRGFGTFDSNKVVFVNIGPSDKLNNFRITLVQALKSYCSLQSQDKRTDNFGYHSTLAMNLNQKEFDLIKEHIKNKQAPDFTQIIMRVTLLKKGKILREYDFMQRRLFNRRQAKNKRVLTRSKSLLKLFMQGKYNPKMRTPSKNIVKKTILERIISFFTRK